MPNSITGSAITYGGGGGGSTDGSAGGSGGGGAGGGTNGTAGTTNLGGGGGGGGPNPDPAFGGNGGSGIVIIAYPNASPTLTSIGGGLSYTQPTRSGFRVYRFTAGTGNITF